jgi:hypothetical protein
MSAARPRSTLSPPPPPIPASVVSRGRALLRRTPDLWQLEVAGRVLPLPRWIRATDEKEVLVYWAAKALDRAGLGQPNDFDLQRWQRTKEGFLR